MKKTVFCRNNRFGRRTALFSLVLLLLVWGMPVDAIPQSVFNVLVAKGDVQVKSGSRWSKLLIGEDVDGDKTIRVGNNAYVGLVYLVSGMPLEINKPGEYEAAELAAGMAQEESLLTKYTSFLLSRDTEYDNRGSATGAVTRGAALKVYLPSNHQSSFYDPSVVIAWEDEPDVTKYEITVTDLLGEALLTMLTPDTTLTLDMLDPYLAGTTAVFIYVNPVDSKKRTTSDGYLLKRLSTARRSMLEEEHNNLTETFEDRSTAFSHFLLTGFYEKNGQIVDAISAFSRAIVLEPGNPFYRNKYKEFLKRNRIGY